MRGRSRVLVVIEGPDAAGKTMLADALAARLDVPVFLLRPQLREVWTMSVHLDVPEQETLRRAMVRDVPAAGTADEVRRRYLDRYLPAQALYRTEADPVRAATVVVDNTDPVRPRIRAWRLDEVGPAG